MAYREGRSPYDVAFELYAEAQRRESLAATEKMNAQIGVARAQADLEIGWAELGAVTALERHLAAIENAMKLAGAKDIPAAHTEDRAEAARKAEAARVKIKAGDEALALARQALHAAADALGDATQARMTAEAEVRKLAPKE